MKPESDLYELSQFAAAYIWETGTLVWIQLPVHECRLPAVALIWQL